MMRDLLMAKQQKKEIVKWLDANRTDSAEMAASDAQAIAYFKSRGLCEHDDYMTVEEAANVTYITPFQQKNNFISWDWSKLINYDQSLYRYGCQNLFYQDSKLNFPYIPSTFGDKATNMYGTWQGCSSLSISELPYGYGQNATTLSNHFTGCKQLRLTHFPNGFGKFSTSFSEFMSGCSYATDELILNDAFATTNNCNIKKAFVYLGASKIVLNEGFGRYSTDYFYLFNSAKSREIVLNRYFGNNATNMAGAFQYCANLELNKLNEGFGQLATNMSYIFYNCSSIKGEFDLNSDNFCENTSSITQMFSATKITSFKGKFNFSKVTDYTLFRLLIPSTCTHIELTPNTLKTSLAIDGSYYSIGSSRLDKDSILSIAVGLYNFGSPQGDKTLTVTSAQKTILDTEMYDDSRTYTQYCEDKGWTVTTEYHEQNSDHN